MRVQREHEALPQAGVVEIAPHVLAKRAVEEEDRHRLGGVDDRLEEAPLRLELLRHQSGCCRRGDGYHNMGRLLQGAVLLHLHSHHSALLHHELAHRRLVLHRQPLGQLIGERRHTPGEAEEAGEHGDT
jgi:hypothetical protein